MQPAGDRLACPKMGRLIPMAMECPVEAVKQSLILLRALLEIRREIQNAEAFTLTNLSHTAIEVKEIALAELPLKLAAPRGIGIHLNGVGKRYDDEVGASPFAFLMHGP